MTPTVWWLTDGKEVVNGRGREAAQDQSGSPMDRREFLRTVARAAPVLLAPLALGACTRAPTPGSAASGTPTEALPTTQGPGQSTSRPPKGRDETLRELGDRLSAEGAAPGLEVYFAGRDFAVGVPAYVGLGLVHEDFGPVSQGEAEVWLTPGADPDAPVSPRGPLRAPWEGYAEPRKDAPPGIHALSATFGRPGVWTVLVRIADREEVLLGTAQIRVRRQPATLAPGDDAIASQTPTRGDRRGVDDICGRDRTCPMHELTLAEAIRNGRPTVFYFGSASAPVPASGLDELLAVRREVGGAVNFVHAEAYQGARTDDEASARRTPTAREWGFSSEPWVYLIDAGGEIFRRYEGPVMAPRVLAAMNAILR